MLVPVWDTRTGKKLPNPVPAHWVGHSKLGPHLSKTPRQKAAEKAATSGTTKAPRRATTKKE